MDAIDYNVYEMGVKEKMAYTFIAAVVIFIVGFIFYRNVLLACLLCPVALKYPKIKNKEIIQKRKKALNHQFKDLLYALASSISAGKSVERAFADALNDLLMIYPEPNTHIIIETQIIIRKLAVNEPIEVVLQDLAKRSHLEDIENFVDVFHTCKRTGGNMVEIIKNTSNIINDKIEIKEEITTMLSARMFEQKVLNIMPIAIIVLLSVSAADYMAPVFSTLVGRVVMTLAIILLLAAYYISKRIMEIEV